MACRAKVGHPNTSPPVEVTNICNGGSPSPIQFARPRQSKQPPASTAWTSDADNSSHPVPFAVIWSLRAGCIWRVQADGLPAGLESRVGHAPLTRHLEQRDGRQ